MAGNEPPVTQTFRVTGLTCADCAAKLEHRLQVMPGVEDVALNFVSAKLTIRHQLPMTAILQQIRVAGYDATPEAERGPARRQTFLQTHYRLLTTLLSGLLVVLAWGLSLAYLSRDITLPLYIAAILVGGLWTIRRGLLSLKSGVFDMNALMTIAVIGASAIGEWNEAATVAFLYSVSNLLESYTMEKTRQSIRGLMELAPQEALVRRDGVERMLPVAQVQVHDLVIVKPGEKIAVDGIVVAGKSCINQAAITGESLPVEKAPGEPVYAGTLNTMGAFEVRATACADDTALAKIIHLVEEAQARRAPSQAFVDRFARYYTPIVLVTALLVAVLPPLVAHQAWFPWIYRALALIVVACPCALVISTPVAIVSAIGNAARHGVLIKGGAYLEQAGRLTVMAFDKTGTLTTGHPEVTDLLPAQGVDPLELLAVAAAVEERSSHPLAQAVLQYAAKAGVAIPVSENHISWPARGAQASLRGEAAYIGNRRFFAELELGIGAVEAMMHAAEARGHTAVLVAQGRRVLGVVAAADVPRAHARAVMQDLHAAGIRHIVLLTGDHRVTGEQIAATLGIDDVRADLLPEEKAGAVTALREQYGAVGMVGDGINDAPALATASVGIAMGVAGTDTALEIADITLMADDLTKLPYTMRLSRRALQVIKQNIIIALAIKGVALALIVPGWLTLWMAVLADMGASIVVTLNGLRLMHGAPEAHAHQDDDHDHPTTCCKDDCHCG
ncbi:MAG TPA: heavy metal translocating P-type ATPase [Armatimonadota bacterium]